MYLKRLYLKDIRSFGEINIDLTSNSGGVKSWAVIFGENGIGKTTILRSIGLVLGDPESAGGLLREVPGDWVRAGLSKNTALIRAEFVDDLNTTCSDKYSIELHISRKRDREAIAKVVPVPEDFPWDKIFVSGYGANRSAFASQTYDRYRTVDSVYTLFSYDMPLQNPELTIRRIKDEGHDVEELLGAIDEVMMLPKGSTRLTQALEIGGPWGRHIPIGAVGDGYRATLSLVIDLIGWAMFFRGSPPKAEEIKGIVLLDEIEQHLHPAWQRRIIGLLAHRFPAIQFIVTTHTPMCAVGTTDLKDEDCDLIVLGREDDRTILVQQSCPPRGMRADQILTSSLFRLPNTSDDTIKEKIERYAQLGSSRNRSQMDNDEYIRLRAELKVFLESRETPLEQLVSEHLKSSVVDTLANEKFDKTAVSSEILRQIKEIFGIKSNDKD